MKETFTIIYIFISIICFGQNEMMEKAHKAFEYYRNGEKYKAVKIFEELIIEYPKSEHYGRNLYNVPTIYQELDSNELAIKWFLKIIEDKNLDDSEKDHSRGIFETNANFKHYSAANIGVINYNSGNYREALKYYQLADVRFPYYNTSGTDIKLNKIKIASNISDCYIKLEKVDNSIVVLLPHALTKSLGTMNKVSEKALKILEDYNKTKEFKKELDKGLEGMKKVNEGIKMTIYNIDVEVYPYSDEELTIGYFKQTDFYKRLN
jgi:tetratricopeptide (TPR) repeat protein